MVEGLGEVTALKDYFRVMLGRGSMYAEVCRQQGFIGAHFGIDQELTSLLGGQQREFSQQVRPTYQQVFPEKSIGSAGLACGFLWTISEGSRWAKSFCQLMGRGVILSAK